MAWHHFKLFQWSMVVFKIYAYTCVRAMRIQTPWYGYHCNVYRFLARIYILLYPAQVIHMVACEV